MLFEKPKKDARAIHEKASEKYNKAFEQMTETARSLHEKRHNCLALIEEIENFVNSIANSPKEIETAVLDIRLERRKFKDTERIAEESFEKSVKTGIGAATVIASGAAVATLGPKIAMWLATTFGTTSKGVAISSLHGAAAANAAYAWIGHIPAAVASSLVTATFGVLSQARLLQKGEISEEDFLDNSQVLCLDMSVSAVTSMLGQVFIPVPVLGAVIGNAAGMVLYGIAKDFLSAREKSMIQGFTESIEKLNQQLDERYQKLVEQLIKEFKKYASIVELAFDPNVNIAFDASVTLADYVGVSQEQVLRSAKDIDDYFLR